jgi:hypothetical protein
MNGAIAKYVKADHDFSLCLGGHFTKSGKATEIQGFSGKLFVFEMTKAQAADMHLGDDQVQLLDTPHQDVFPVLTEARIDKVELSNRGTLDLSQPITGKVTVSPLHTLGDSGDYSVRMTCQTAQARFSMFCPIPSGPGTQATYDCKFKAADRNAQYAGPLTIIVDFCRTTRFGQGNFSVEVLSNSYSTVVDAKPAK